jgi:hypothetical protein
MWFSRNSVIILLKLESEAAIEFLEVFQAPQEGGDDNRIRIIGRGVNDPGTRIHCRAARCGAARGPFDYFEIRVNI